MGENRQLQEMNHLAGVRISQKGQYFKIVIVVPEADQWCTNLPFICVSYWLLLGPGEQLWQGCRVFLC